MNMVSYKIEKEQALKLVPAQLFN